MIPIGVNRGYGDELPFYKGALYVNENEYEWEYKEGKVGLAKLPEWELSLYSTKKGLDFGIIDPVRNSYDNECRCIAASKGPSIVNGYIAITLHPNGGNEYGDSLLFRLDKDKTQNRSWVARIPHADASDLFERVFSESMQSGSSEKHPDIVIDLDDFNSLGSEEDDEMNEGGDQE
jgi:hypothetical protein